MGHSTTADGRRDSLPNEFFENLTRKQRVLLEILLDADGEYIRGVDIREQMRDEYNMDVPYDPGAVAGLLGGLTRRYSESFRRDVIPGRWEDESHVHAEFKIGPKYESEIRADLK